MIIKRFPSILFLSLFVYTAGVVCQQTPLSLKDLSPSERFSSVEGGFSMAAPKTGATYAVMSEAELGAGNTGGQYMWVLREGILVTNFVAFGPDIPSFTPDNFKLYVVNVKKGFFDVIKGKVNSEEYGQSGSVYTYRADFELEDGRKGMARVYSKGKTGVNVFAVAQKDVADAQTLLTKALDSFAMAAQEKKME